MTPAEVSRIAKQMISALDTVIVGKSAQNKQAVLVLFCGSHLLIEDVPGVGKTTLAKALAKVSGGQFSRIQFTPDLLPSDVTGTSIYNQNSREFEFHKGPLFANVVLADEINRASPKTQSALLEAMEERTVTVDGVERSVPLPFMVIATQNNVEMAGTFPLPEAQMDRFFGRISLGYPNREVEREMLAAQREAHPLEELRPAVSSEELLQIQRAIRQVTIDPSVQNYVVEVVRATREHSHIYLGASPRAALHLQLAAQASACLEDRTFVTPDDVKACAVLVLAHRILVRGESRTLLDGSESVIQSILKTVPAPVPVR